MIFSLKLIAIAIFLFISNMAIAANIDFGTIYNNASKNCTDNKMKEICTNVNGSNSVCHPDKSNAIVAGKEASKHEDCLNFQPEENHIEPKFSTKRPRGQ